MRGDGDQPPVTIEEDRKRGGSKGHEVTLQKLLTQAGLMRACSSDGVTALGPAGVRLLNADNLAMRVRPEFMLEAPSSGGRGLSKGERDEDSEKGKVAKEAGKTYLPWSVYRKHQRAREQQSDEKGKEVELKDDAERVERRRKLGLPDEDAIMPLWDMPRDSLKALGLPRAVVWLSFLCP